MRSDEEIEAMCSKRGDGHHTHADAHSPNFDGPVHSHPGYPTHDHAAIDVYIAANFHAAVVRETEQAERDQQL